MRYKLELVLFTCLIFLAGALGYWQGQYIAALRYSPDQSHSILLVGATVGWIFIYSLIKKDLRLNFPYRKIFLLLILDLFVVCFFRNDFSKSLRNFTSILLTYGIVFFLSSLIQSIKLKHVLFILNLVILLVIGASAFVHVTKVGPLTFFAHDNMMLRMGGLFPFSNIGLLAGFSLVVSLISFWLKPSKLNIIYNSIQIVLMLVTIALTDIRSALLTAVFVGIIAILLMVKNKGQRLSLILAIIIISTVGYFAYNIYIANTTGQQTLTESLSYRSEIWKLAVRGTFERPFSGFGSESYLASTIEAGTLQPGLFDSHSAILGLTLQSGIPAILLFLILYVSIFTRTFKSNFKPIVSLGLYWLIAPFFWGDVYMQTIGFIQIIFEITFIGLLLHGDLYSQEKEIESA